MALKTKYIVWEDKYKTGYKRIDEQHIELIKIINNLYNCLEHKSDGEIYIQNAFKDALKKTVDYVAYHFSYEEKIMHAIKYDRILEHSSYHRDFTQNIFEYVKSYENGSLDDINNLIVYLKNWLLNHILVMDKEFVREVKDKLKKISDEE